MDKPKTIVAFPGREAFGKERKDDFYRSFPEVRRVFELAGDFFIRISFPCATGPTHWKKDGCLLYWRCTAMRFLGWFAG